MARTRKLNRWGKVSEIDRRIKVGSKAFYGQEKRLQHLMSWRRMHMQAGGHMSVRMYGTRYGVRPSSNLSIGKKVKYVRRHVD